MTQTATGWTCYTPRVLRAYDRLVHGFSNPWIWRCPTQRLVDWYDRHVSAHHLDIGVGTGYFLDRCRFPRPDPRITLWDANLHCLRCASRRIARYVPEACCIDILAPTLPSSGPFDSIGLMYLLHCLPRHADDKVALLERLQGLLSPEGTLFGATLLAQGVRRGRAARWLMAYYNRSGIFHNATDSLETLARGLTRSYAQSEVEVVGCVALFCARRS